MDSIRTMYSLAHTTLNIALFNSHVGYMNWSEQEGNVLYLGQMEKAFIFTSNCKRFQCNISLF